MTNTDNTTQITGTGAYAGLVWNGKQWTAPGNDGQLVPVKVTVDKPAGLSAGRIIGAVLALIVAGIAALQGWSWFQGFVDLQADDNPFAGMLALFGMAAWAVAAGFGITGLVLLSKKR